MVHDKNKIKTVSVPTTIYKIIRYNNSNNTYSQNCDDEKVSRIKLDHLYGIGRTDIL